MTQVHLALPALGVCLALAAPAPAAQSSAVVEKGVVYVGHDGAASVSALDATTGQILWQTNTGGIVYSSPTVVKGVIYVGHDGTASLSAIDATTGQILWQDSLDGAVLSSPTVVKDIIYVVSAVNSVYAIDATTGAIIWVTHAGS